MFREQQKELNNHLLDLTEMCTTIQRWSYSAPFFPQKILTEMSFYGVIFAKHGFHSMEGFLR